MDLFDVGGRPGILLGSSARWDEESDSDEQDTTSLDFHGKELT